MLILNTDLYKLFRPLLFTLPPETAQAAAEFALKRAWVWRALSPALETRDPRLQVDLCGLKLGNPVGLAAGYDKNCEFLPSMAALGFGYVTGGTVTESARPGNPRPRVLRYAERQSLINSLGFPSRGLEFAARRLERTHPSANAPVIVSVSGVTEDEIVGCHRRLEPMADAIEINISSPNTAGLRVFQQPPALAELLGKVNDERQKPLFVKLPPYSSSTTGPAVNEGRDQVLALARVSKEQGAEGLTVANSRPSEDSRLAVASGGLSGKAIFPDLLRMVADVKAEVGDALAINACGGIFTGRDAWQALWAGATTVQLLTGLIYRGPDISRSINRELLAIMDENGVASLASMSAASRPG